MKVELKRIFLGDTYTIGKLYINGELYCDTIEDKDRGLNSHMTEEGILKIKKKHKTAIPKGIYTIVMNIFSPAFGNREYYKKFCNGLLPRLLGVKGFDGILIHRGVDEDSTSGCIIVGYNTTKGKVTNSQEAFEKVYAKLKEASDIGEQITIEIM